MMLFVKKNWKSLCGIVALAITIMILLVPYTTANYWYDDASWALLVQQPGFSYFTACLADIMNWINMDGRVLLYFFVGHALFSWVPNVLFYHLILDCMFLINIALCMVIIKKLNFNINFILVFVFILFSLLHITPYADPIAAYGAMYPLLGIFFCISCIFLIRWTASFSDKYLYASSAIIFVSLWFYEMNLMYYPLTFCVFFSFRNRVSIKKPLLITFIPLLCFLTTTLYLRHEVQHPMYEGITFGHANLYLITYLKQLFSPLPGIFYFTQGILSYNLDSLWHDLKENMYSGLLFVSSVIVLFCFLSKRKTKSADVKQGTNALFLFVGGLLLLMPIFMAVSAKYQMTLSWGVGYLPIYYQYFALAILITGLLFKITKNVFLKILLIPIIALYTTGNWIENLHVEKVLNNISVQLFASQIQKK